MPEYKMKINYNNRKFRVISNSQNGEVSDEMIFHYKQTNSILTCSYKGEHIMEGHLIGEIKASGRIKMNYLQVNFNGEIMTGECASTPEVMANGKIRLVEEWQWTSGDKSKGSSILEEI